MRSALHALGDGWKSLLKPGQVNERRHQSWHLDVRSLNQVVDEELQGRQPRLKVGRLRWSHGRCRWQGLVKLGLTFATNDLRCLVRQVGNHVLRDREVDEVVQSECVLRRCWG